MPKEPNENRAMAKELFDEGMALVDIAKKLGISENTVRSWKARHWGDKNQKEKQKKTVMAFQTPDSRPATKNCNVAGKKPGKKKTRRKGAGPPLNNKNALKHGGYSKIYWDTLDEEELEILADMQTDTEFLLIQQIQLFTIRERRLMKAITKYMDSGPLYVALSSTEKLGRKFKDEEEEAEYNRRVKEKIRKGERMPGESNKLYSQSNATEDLLNRLRRELTSVQSQKTKAIMALQAYRIHVEEMQHASAGNDAVDDWITAVMGGDEDEF